MEREQLKKLLDRQPKGTSLLREFYSDPDIFERDIERIHLRHWICVGHESRVPKRGDWFRSDLAKESVLIVRGRDSKLRALINVCRHRGSRVCYEDHGNTHALVCPYHGWTYDLDGKLRSARHFDADFDTSDYALKEIHLEVLEGLIFICFAAQPPKLEAVERTLHASVGHYGWKNARVAHRETYQVDANWKLVTENYQECYHCSPAHPEFARHHASTKPDEDEEVLALRSEARSRALEMGIDIPEVEDWPLGCGPNQEGINCSYDATFNGALTGSEDGAPVAPLMGNFSAYDGGFTYLDIGPSSFYLAYPDHGLIYLFLPHSPQKTEMEVLWLVEADAQEGTDYEIKRLTWLWHVTSLADKLIIDQNQKGVNSRYYQPGPYNSMEEQTQRFIEWYLDKIALGPDA